MQHLELSGRTIAYFSMEIGLDEKLPTYSGGLGVLAGDSIRSAADLGLPMVAMTLLYRKGYFLQSLHEGHQSEAPVSWEPSKLLQAIGTKVSVKIEGRPVVVTAHKYEVEGVGGHKVPVIFLDTDLPENSAEDRKLTDHLYGGDETYRLQQEIVLGIGGVKMLAALGLGPQNGVSDGLKTYHMNEGHAALLTVALLETKLAGRPLAHATPEDRQYVKSLCAFTTHTPVPAGHDSFPVALVEKTLGKEYADLFMAMEVCPEGRLNMSHLALKHSRYTNGVAKRHGEVSKQMFPDYQIEAITNGIHAGKWVAEPMGQLFDEMMPNWRQDNNYLRDAIELPLDKLAAARRRSKELLFAQIEKTVHVKLDPDVFTIGFARRAAEYKRGNLFFHDLERLKQAADQGKGLQIVFAGKAHPKDQGGKDLIAKICAALGELHGSKVKGVYIPNYGMDWGRLICGGVDLWLNNPVKPLEASGTSGMKAALNGIPSFSTLDGWWVEGCVEGITGWEIEDEAYAFGQGKEEDEKFRRDTARRLYEKLESTILPLFYNDHAKFMEVARYAIALNAPFFNTQRMMEQYNRLAYR